MIVRKFISFSKHTLLVASVASTVLACLMSCSSDAPKLCTGKAPSDKEKTPPADEIPQSSSENLEALNDLLKSENEPLPGANGLRTTGNSEIGQDPSTGVPSTGIAPDGTGRTAASRLSLTPPKAAERACEKSVFRTLVSGLRSGSASGTTGDDNFLG